jgi:hypothetical protein
MWAPHPYPQYFEKKIAERAGGHFTMIGSGIKKKSYSAQLGAVP